MINNLIIKPGNGWHHLSGPVWEHTKGLRIHTMGMIRMKDNTCLFLNNWDEGALGRLLISINGENRKRGLMCWALNENSQKH